MDSRLAFAVELEQRDATVAERIDELAATSAEVERIRARAAEIGSRLEGVPAERAHLDEADAEAARAFEQAQAALARAEEALARAHGADAREQAELTRARAATAVRGEEERRERLAARRATLEHEAEQLAAEALELERGAAALAGRLDGSSRVSATAPPAPGLAGVVDWGARAHAAVLLARAGLDSERDRLVREANELASSVLGEPLYTASVPLVRRRLEEELASIRDSGGAVERAHDLPLLERAAIRALDPPLQANEGLDEPEARHDRVADHPEPVLGNGHSASYPPIGEFSLLDRSESARRGR